MCLKALSGSSAHHLYLPLAKDAPASTIAPRGPLDDSSEGGFGPTKSGT